MIALALEGVSLRELREDWDSRDVDTAFDILAARDRAQRGKTRQVVDGG